MSDPEIHHGELVAIDPDPDPTRAALDRAAQHAIDNPGVAGRDEFLALAAQARILSMSGAAPEAVRDDPYVAFHLALVGRDFGLSPSAALNLIDILPIRKNGRVVGHQFSLSPQMMNAQIRRLGLGSIFPAVRTATRCVAVALTPDGLIDHRCTGDRWPNHVEDCSCRGIIGESEFTWEDARMADLVGPECEPGHHVKTTRSSGDRTWQACGCNQGYITYPKRMMWWRASGFAADDWFPEAGLGMYQSEALAEFVDEHGRALDPATVELPEGYRPAGEDFAPAAVIERVQARIDALPDAARAEVTRLWHEHEPRLWKLGEMRAHEAGDWDRILTAVEMGVLEGRYSDDTASEGETPSEEPADDPGAGETPPSDDPQDDAPAEPTIESIAEEVKHTDLALVTAALDDAGIDHTGWNAQTKRARLAQHRASEAGLL